MLTRIRMRAMVCKRVHYRGMVQGVGFRMTAKRLADRHEVSGYVKNLADGRVETVVAGEAQEVDRFLADLAERMRSYIQGQDIQDEPMQSFPNFEIRV